MSPEDLFHSSDFLAIIMEELEYYIIPGKCKNIFVSGSINENVYLYFFLTGNDFVEIKCIQLFISLLMYL